MNDLIERQVAYEEGYSAGKLCTAQQVLDELEELLTEAQTYATTQRDKNNPQEDGFTYFTGKAAAYSELLRILPKLKKKFEVD